MARLLPCLSRAAGALAVLVAAAPAAAQTTFSAELLGASAYIWRGITQTNRPVVDATITLAQVVGGTTFTAGAWGNVEPVHFSGPQDISSLGAAHGPALTQSMLWAQGARSVGRVALTAGVNEYLYPRTSDLRARYQTTELFGAVAFDAPLAPSVTFSHDVGKIRGGYLETAIGHAVPLGRTHALALSAAAGYSVGQAERAAGDQSAYFAEDGLTHVDVGASTTFAAGPLALVPTAHVVFGRDAYARIAAPNTERAAKLWIGTTVRWSHERGARSNSAPNTGSTPNASGSDAGRASGGTDAKAPAGR